jgi:predicted nucleic acid-binding protein
LTRFVLDASVTMAWCFEDETTPYSEAVLDALVRGATARVPAIWPFEVLNVVLGATRRTRLSPANARTFLAELRAFPILVDPTETAHVFHLVRTNAEHYHLTAYDAAYLELALREGLPLATLDRGLRDAAVAGGLEIFAGA